MFHSVYKGRESERVSIVGTVSQPDMLLPLENSESKPRSKTPSRDLSHMRHPSDAMTPNYFLNNRESLKTHLQATESVNDGDPNIDLMYHPIKIVQKSPLSNEEVGATTSPNDRSSGYRSQTRNTGYSGYE